MESKNNGRKTGRGALGERRHAGVAGVSDAKTMMAVNLGGEEMMKWTAHQVGQWLAQIGMGAYQEVFEKNDIQGQHLPRLTEEMLKDMGVEIIGHRIRILTRTRNFAKATNLAKRNKVLKEVMNWKLCNCCRCWDTRYRISEAAIEIVKPDCIGIQIDHVDMSAIDDLSLQRNCVTGTVQLNTSDPSAGNFSIRLSKSEYKRVFRLLKDLSEQDQYRLQRAGISGSRPGEPDIII